MSVPRLAFFGDSLFAGYGLAPNQALPARVEALLRVEGREIRALNFGVSGETAADGLRRLHRVLAGAPAACLLEFGANDSFQGYSPAEVEQNLEALVTALRGAGLPVLLVGVRCLAFEDEYPAEAFEAVHPALAKRHGLPLFPDILAPYVEDPDLLLPDGLHPNADGVEAMARALLPQARDLLETVASNPLPR